MNTPLNKTRVIALWLFTANIVVVTTAATSDKARGIVIVLWLASVITIGLSLMVFAFVMKERSQRQHYEASQYALMNTKPFEHVFASAKARLDYTFVTTVLAMRADQCEILSHRRFVDFNAIDCVVEIDHIVIDTTGCFLIKTLDDDQSQAVHIEKGKMLLHKQRTVLHAHTGIDFHVMLVTPHQRSLHQACTTPIAFTNRLRFTLPLYSETKVQTLYDQIEKAASPSRNNTVEAHPKKRTSTRMT